MLGWIRVLGPSRGFWRCEQKVVCGQYWRQRGSILSSRKERIIEITMPTSILDLVKPFFFKLTPQLLDLCQAQLETLTVLNVIVHPCQVWQINHLIWRKVLYIATHKVETIFSRFISSHLLLFPCLRGVCGILIRGTIVVSCAIHGSMQSAIRLCPKMRGYRIIILVDDIWANIGERQKVVVNETGKYRSLRKQTLNPVCRALNRSVSGSTRSRAMVVKEVYNIGEESRV